MVCLPKTGDPSPGFYSSGTGGGCEGAWPPEINANYLYLFSLLGRVQSCQQLVLKMPREFLTGSDHWPGEVHSQWKHPVSCQDSLPTKFLGKKVILSYKGLAAYQNKPVKCTPSEAIMDEFRCTDKPQPRLQFDSLWLVQLTDELISKDTFLTVEAVHP